MTSNHLEEKRLFRISLILAVLTVVYNLFEGLVSVYFGIKDETLTLFGFGADSFVETISALGVSSMIIRLQRNPQSERSSFEMNALKITGWCFYALVLILFFSILFNLYRGNNPQSTKAGVIISLISIFSMWLLIRAKISLGRKLNSAPIIADARCNQVCLYMSLVLLIASGSWAFLRIPYIDAVGTAAIIYFSFNEGREAFDKAKGIDSCGCETD